MGAVLDIIEREDGPSDELDEKENVEGDDFANVVRPVDKELSFHLNLNYIPLLYILWIRYLDQFGVD